jgi:tRNA (cmo5U34)-methyltransferase
MKPNPFDAQAASAYAEGPPRMVPGYGDLHRMVSMLIAERAPQDARVLVLGAGGGLEIKALADAHPGWTFDGVDPSPAMLQLAAKTVERHAARVHLHEGMIGDAPEGPFDAATCILTFHFIPRIERLETLRQIRRRLRTGAPFVLVHLSFPQSEPERSLWMRRHIAWGHPDGADPAKAESALKAMLSGLTILPPEEEEAMLRQAGFEGVGLFYAGLSVKGWVGYASGA